MSTQLLEEQERPAVSESGGQDEVAPKKARWALAPLVRCAALALVVTGLVTGIGVAIQEYYHLRAHYHYDSASYRFQSVGVFDTYQQEGLWATLDELLQQQNCFDVLVRLLVYPPSLCQFHGHLWVQVPLTAIFFFLTLLYVYHQSGSYFWGLAIVTVTFVFRPLYHPNQGIADYWKDNLGIWMLGSALLCWFFSEQGCRRGWSLSSGLFWSMLALQRPVIAVYGALLFAPFLAVGVYRRFRQDDWATFSKNAVAFGVIPLATAALMLGLQTESLRHHYFVVGYDYASPAQIAAWMVHHPFAASWTLWIGVGAVFAVLLVTLWGCWIARGPSIAAALWLTAGFPALVIATHARYHAFAAVLLVLVLVSLALLTARHLSPRATRWAALLLFAIAAGSSLFQARDCLPWVKRLSLARADFRALYDEIGEVLKESSPETRYGLFFDACHRLVWVQMYFDHGIQTNRKPFFMAIREGQYRFHFPGMNADEMAAAIVADMEEERDGVAVIHENPQDLVRIIPGGAESPDCLPVTVNARIGEHLRHSDRWEAVKRIESRRYGTLVIYRLLRQPENS